MGTQNPGIWKDSDSMAGKWVRTVTDEEICCVQVQNSRLYEPQAGIKFARRNNNLRYVDDTTLMAESEEELKSLLMKVKEESEKAGLKQHSKN